MGRGPRRGAGRGRGRGGPPSGAGPRGKGPGRPEFCVCPNCGIKVPKLPRIPCNQTHCPNCGMQMVRG
ncbi:MAG TPA: hypothetical protein EYP65_00940 [Armatimonadetes bacterium]|nr:hypothetical protein [Armatimonadota bacterium]